MRRGTLFVVLTWLVVVAFFAMNTSAQAEPMKHDFFSPICSCCLAVGGDCKKLCCCSPQVSTCDELCCGEDCCQQQTVSPYRLNQELLRLDRAHE